MNTAGHVHNRAQAGCEEPGRTAAIFSLLARVRKAPHRP